MTTPSGRDLSTAVDLIKQEHKYEKFPPDKAVHKFLYFIDKKGNNSGLDVSIPYFWYQFGTLSPVEQSRPPPGDQRNRLEDELRPIVTEVLDEYYATSLEELTDRMYEDAPYEVQRDWRVLDKKIRTLHPDYIDFYEVEPSRNSIKESIYDVYDSFPSVRYLKDSDVTKWYSLMTRELYQDELDVDRLMVVNLTFWRIIALWLAEHHRHHLSKRNVKAILSIESFDKSREKGRSRLWEIEGEALDEKFGGADMQDTPRAKAADAVVRSMLNSPQ